MGENQEDGFCLYDVLSGSGNGGIDAVEERIMAEQFQDSLTTKEQRLFRLMNAGCSVSQICAELDADEDEVIELGKEIGRKRRQFYDVA